MNNQYNIGSVYYLLENYDQAFSAYKFVQKHISKILKGRDEDDSGGENDVFLLDTESSICDVQYRRGQHDLALVGYQHLLLRLEKVIELNEQIAALDEKIVGENDIQLIRCIKRIANIFTLQENYIQADSSYRRIISYFESDVRYNTSAFPYQNQIYLTFYSLGNVYYKLEFYKHAEKYLKKAMPLDKEEIHDKLIKVLIIQKNYTD